MHLIFSNRRLFFLAIILIVSNIVITGISMLVIYKRSFASLENSLMDVTERQKSLVTTLQEQGKNENEIIQFVQSMRQKHYSIGRAGEFEIAKNMGDSANYFLSKNQHTVYVINNAQKHGLPMQLAFEGKTGIVSAEDYMGLKVLAAYTYVPSLKWGIVTKIPISEVYEPYLNAFFTAIIIFTILLSLSIYLFVKISNPIIQSIIASEEKFSKAIKLAPFPIMIHAEDGEVLNISKGWTDITGYNLSDLPTVEKWTELAYGTHWQNIKEYIDTLYNSEGSKYEGEYEVTCNNSKKRIWDFSSAPLGKLSDGRRAVISMAKDITESKQIEYEREVTIKLLSLLNQSNDMHSLMSTLTLFLCNWTGCEAVGIRLRDGDDYPYYETHGFSDDFVIKEKYLCAYDIKGQLIRDDVGNPVLECMCGNILCNRFDPSKPFFTPKGSFWSNCTSELLSTTTETDRQGHTRNRCNGQGYESVALIPLKYGTETFGLIQLNDKRTGQFTPDMIALIERLSDNISLALFQRKTQKALSESEERFKMLFDKAPIGYQSLNSDGCFIDVNETWLEILGYNKEEVIGRWFGDFLAPEYVNTFKEQYPLFKSTSSIHSEFEMIKKDGSVVFIALEGRIGHTETGEFKQTHCVLNDITKRRIAENLLKENNSRLELAMKVANMAWWEMNMPSGNVKFENRKAEMLGYSPEQFRKYSDFVELLHPDDSEKAMNIMHSHLNGETDKYEIEYRIRTNTGDYKWFYDIGSITKRDIHGTPKSIAGLVIDITERKLAEEEQKRIEALMSTAVENIPIIFYIIDKKGNFALSIGAGLKSLGLLPNQVVGMSAFDIYKDYPEIINAIHEALSGEITHFESNVNGAYHFNILSPYSVSNKNKGIVGVALDITERKRAELLLQEKNNEIEAQNEEYRQINEELRIAKEHAEESDRLKTAFLQNMSHEIRTPMNAIMGFSELLTKNYDNKPKLQHFSEIINQRCSDLLDLINDLLDIAKIESGQLPVSYDNCNLTNLFSELKTFFIEQQVRMNKKEISFDMVANCDLQGITISTDKVKLRQILINLINNAFKFTQKGKIEGGCMVDENQQLVFYVSDTGIGIPKDKHQYIFERFSQVNNGISRLYGGTGLGLSIVKGLVGLLGGSVWLDSEPGKGSTFYFTIAYNRQLSETPLNNKEIMPQTFHFRDKTILVVEDDTYNMALIKEILSGTNLNILYAENGSDAIKIALSDIPELVLIDIGLPDMLGYEAIRQILSKQPDMKIVAQTAYATLDDRNKAMNSGCIDYISKPLKAEKLLSTINKYLS